MTPRPPCAGGTRLDGNGNYAITVAGAGLNVAVSATNISRARLKRLLAVVSLLSLNLRRLRAPTAGAKSFKEPATYDIPIN